jgi:hypothetical protein
VNTAPVNGVTLAMASGQLDLSQLGKGERRLPVSDPAPVVNSTANQPAESVAAIKARKSAARAERAANLADELAQAEAAASAGDQQAARVHWLRALELTDSAAQRREIRSKLGRQ